ncbi:hypothetical protein BJX62DRAFT_221343 [Aspergillus germanicus]
MTRNLASQMRQRTFALGYPGRRTSSLIVMSWDRRRKSTRMRRACWPLSAATETPSRPTRPISRNQSRIQRSDSSPQPPLPKIARASISNSRATILLS